MSAYRVGDLVIADVEPGAVYVLRSRINDRIDGDVDLLHVISRYAGGEIRGYWRPHDDAGPWRLRYPARPESYEIVDQAVANLMREPVRGFDGLMRPAALTGQLALGGIA